MNRTTRRAEDLYNRYRSGESSYADERYGFQPTLASILEFCTVDQTVHHIGCGHGHWARHLVGLRVAPRVRS